MNDIGPQDIAYLLELCSKNDPDSVRHRAREKIRSFIRSRWKMTIPQLRNFLKSNYLRPNEYDFYLFNL